MGIVKHGTGDVLREPEEAQKTASTENPQQRAERLAALAKENEQADQPKKDQE